MAGARRDPFTSFRFLVEIDGLAEAAFAEVSGLGAEAEVVEYREGADRPAATRKLPGLRKYSNIVLKRGYTEDRSLWDWWETGATGRVQRRNVAIVLLDEELQPVRRWLVRDAWITKYEGPTLNARSGGVAIETIELAHEGLELD